MVFEVDWNNVGILFCIVKVNEWLLVLLVIDSKIIGIIYKNLSVLNLNIIDFFVLVFSLVFLDNVRVSVNVFFENIFLSLCFILKNFICFVIYKYID